MCRLEVDLKNMYELDVTNTQNLDINCITMLMIRMNYANDMNTDFNYMDMCEKRGHPS